MQELTVTEARLAQLKLLKALDAFCKENDISYFLCNGTLLGAVKYKGYIPWDDDIDVCLPRKDYEKLIASYSEKVNKGHYELFSIATHPNYYFPFAKFADQTTVVKEHGVNNGVEFGLNIDIFPLDNYGNNPKELERVFKKFRYLRKQLNLAKLSDFKSANPIKSLMKRVVTLPFRLIGPAHFCEKINRAAFASKKKTAFIGNAVWGFYGIGEAQKQEIYEETVWVDFEGGKYPAPVGYDLYLRGLYGDYEQDPPVEKQVTHHRYTAYKGQY